MLKGVLILGGPVKGSPTSSLPALILLPAE